MFKKLLSIIIVLALSIATLQPEAIAAVPNDSTALKGAKSGKAIFDINLSDALKLPVYLNVIKETRAGLIKQGVKPEFVVTFRGTAVKLVSTDRDDFDAEQKEALSRSDAMIGDLNKSGVNLEACAVATDLYGIENSSILPQVKVVGNTFISIIGYQSKGYALIPIQ
ncbi:MAG: DsrE family protein [Desulfuromonadaceae bacterium]